ncbi:Glycosyl transferases group 1 [Pedobacter westerhofensis]|uniref:Glycosyl transferases group 1 n=2 Tax=Pedobacter westerhofensis TaxID=425512 RepID=A0A521C5T6_9SPHI|nr:Glycosyl transferases group 1 [Pedobacter westerhofensis]
MKIVVTHPTGNRNLRAVISSFEEAGILAGFNTTLAVNPNSFLVGMLPEKIRKEFVRRSYPVDFSHVNTRPLLELSRNILPKIGFKGAAAHESGFASVDKVYEDLDKATAASLGKLVKIRQLTAVYAYEDGALATFTKAKKLGLKCIYDLPIAYWETLRRLMFEEAERLPNWVPTLGGGIRDSQAKLDRKTRELEMADVVVGPGKFVLDSLPAWASDKKLIMSPFGSPVAVDGEETINNIDYKRPLRVLFAGSLGQRKGLGDLFKAVSMLDPNKIELVVMGSLLAPLEFYKAQLPNFSYEKGRPNAQVLELMRSCDVFCLPSIVEGRALVMQEAMSQGLPLLITPNTGGEDLVIQGETGFLVPIRSPEQLAEHLNWYIEHREETKEMGAKAKAHAANYTWKGYGDTIVSDLKELYAK